MHGLTGERWTSLHYKHELGSQQNEAPSAALERVLLSPSCRTSHVQPGVVGWLKEIGERFKSPTDMASSSRAGARVVRPAARGLAATYLMPDWEQDGSGEIPADAARHCDRTSVTASELREQPYALRSQACVLSSHRRALPLKWPGISAERHTTQPTSPSPGQHDLSDAHLGAAGEAGEGQDEDG